MIACMQERQKPIVEWMHGVMQRRDLSPRAWAERAKIGKDTVSRAIREDYEFVTSTSTISRLAEAVDEKPFGLAAAVPSVDALREVIDVLHPIHLGSNPQADTVTALAQSLHDTLLHLLDDPEATEDRKVLRALARAAARRRGHQGA